MDQVETHSCILLDWLNNNLSTQKYLTFEFSKINIFLSHASVWALVGLWQY